MNQIRENLLNAYSECYSRNPDIAGDAYLATLEKGKTAGSEFDAESYFKAVFFKRIHARPTEKGKNNSKEVYISFGQEEDIENETSNSVFEGVLSKVEEGYEKVEDAVSLKQTIDRLIDEVALHNLDISEMVDAMMTMLNSLEAKGIPDILSEITISKYVSVPIIRDLLKEALTSKGALAKLTC